MILVYDPTELAMSFDETHDEEFFSAKRKSVAEDFTKLENEHFGGIFMEEIKHLMLFARAACLKESEEEMRKKSTNRSLGRP